MQARELRTPAALEVNRTAVLSELFVAFLPQDHVPEPFKPLTDVNTHPRVTSTTEVPILFEIDFVKYVGLFFTEAEKCQGQRSKFHFQLYLLFSEAMKRGTVDNILVVEFS